MYLTFDNESIALKVYSGCILFTKFLLGHDVLLSLGETLSHI